MTLLNCAQSKLLADVDQGGLWISHLTLDVRCRAIAAWDIGLVRGRVNSESNKASQGFTQDMSASAEVGVGVRRFLDNPPRASSNDSSLARPFQLRYQDKARLPSRTRQP